MVAVAYSRVRIYVLYTAVRNRVTFFETLPMSQYDPYLNLEYLTKH